MKPRPPAAPTEMTGMFMRVFWFVATNLAVLALLSVVMSVLGVTPDQFGGLLVMAAPFGFGGAFVSLLMSKWIATRSPGAQVIGNPRNEAEPLFLDPVRRQAQAEGRGMPEGLVYPTPDITLLTTTTK